MFFTPYGAFTIIWTQPHFKTTGQGQERKNYLDFKDVLLNVSLRVDRECWKLQEECLTFIYSEFIKMDCLWMIWNVSSQISWLLDWVVYKITSKGLVFISCLFRAPFLFMTLQALTWLLIVSNSKKEDFLLSQEKHEVGFDELYLLQQGLSYERTGICKTNKYDWKYSYKLPLTTIGPEHLLSGMIAKEDIRWPQHLIFPVSFLTNVARQKFVGRVTSSNSVTPGYSNHHKCTMVVKVPKLQLCDCHPTFVHLWRLHAISWSHKIAIYDFLYEIPRQL